MNIMQNRVTAIIAIACLVLNGCGVRPATTYQTQPATPSTFQVAPAGQMQAPQPPSATPPAAGQAPAEAAQPVPVPVEEDTDFLQNMATGYVGPAILVIGTVAAAGLFFWANTHWFQD